MKLIDGIFKYGETVAIDIDGKLYKRKVHYYDGELYVDIDGKRIKEGDLAGSKRFDKAAYDSYYAKEKCAQFSIKMPKKQGEVWRQTAADLGMSMNAFIIYCVEKEIHGQ